MQLDQKLIDKLTINDLQDRYAQAANQVDVEGYRALWAEDATWDIVGQRAEGRDAIVDLCSNSSRTRRSSSCTSPTAGSIWIMTPAPAPACGW